MKYTDRKLNLYILSLLLIMIFSFISALNFSFAWFTDHEHQNLTFSLPEVSLGEVYNNIVDNHIEFENGETFDNIIFSINLSTNINLQMRIILEPIWKNDSDEIQDSLPVNFCINTSNDFINNNFEFYSYEIITADISEINFECSINFNFLSEEDAQLYDGLYLEFSVTFDFHQNDYINYNEHGWKKAPQQWLDYMENGE